MTAALAHKSQMVIPKAILDRINLEFGDFGVSPLNQGLVLRPRPEKVNQGVAAHHSNVSGEPGLPDMGPTRLTRLCRMRVLVESNFFSEKLPLRLNSKVIAYLAKD